MSQPSELPYTQHPQQPPHPHQHATAASASAFWQSEARSYLSAKGSPAPTSDEVQAAIQHLMSKRGSEEKSSLAANYQQQPPPLPHGQHVNPANMSSVNSTTNPANPNEQVPRAPTENEIQVINSVFRNAFVQTLKSSRPEMQQYLGQLKAESDGKFLVANIQSEKISVPVPVQRRPPMYPPLHSTPAQSPTLAPTQHTPVADDNGRSSNDNKIRSKRNKEDRNKEDKGKLRKGDKEKDKDKDLRKKEKKRKSSPSSDTENSAKKQKTRPSTSPAVPTDPDTEEPESPSAVLAAQASKAATDDIVAMSTSQAAQLDANAAQIAALQSAMTARTTALNNNESVRQRRELVQQERERQQKLREAEDQRLTLMMQQVEEQERQLKQLQQQRQQLEAEESANLQHKLKQDEFVIDIQSVRKRFLYKINDTELSASSESMVRVEDDEVIKLVCLACQNHLRDFVDSLLASKQKRREDERKEFERRHHRLIEHRPVLETVQDIERQRQIVWMRRAAVKAAKLAGKTDDEANSEVEKTVKAFVDASTEAQQRPSQSLRTRGSDPHLLTVIDFAFAMENDRMLRLSPRLSTVLARIEQRIKQWPAAFQPPTVVDTVSRNNNVPNVDMPSMPTALEFPAFVLQSHLSSPQPADSPNNLIGGGDDLENLLDDAFGSQPSQDTDTVNDGSQSPSQFSLLHSELNGLSQSSAPDATEPSNVGGGDVHSMLDELMGIE